MMIYPFVEVHRKEKVAIFLMRLLITCETTRSRMRNAILGIALLTKGRLLIFFFKFHFEASNIPSARIQAPNATFNIFLCSKLVNSNASKYRSPP